MKARRLAVGHVADRNTRRGDEQADEVRRVLNSNPANDGALVEDVAIQLVAGVEVAHKLGRRPVGFEVRGRNGPGAVRMVSPGEAHVQFHADYTVTVDVWVY